MSKFKAQNYIGKDALIVRLPLGGQGLSMNDLELLEKSTELNNTSFGQQLTLILQRYNLEIKNKLNAIRKDK